MEYKLIVSNKEEALQVSIPDKEIKQMIYLYDTFNINNTKKDIAKIIYVFIQSLEKFLEEKERTNK